MSTGENIARCVLATLVRYVPFSVSFRRRKLVHQIT